MEGLADFWVRQALTDIGGYDWCVTEFVRVSGSLLPPRVFYRWCPELRTGARTRSGTPVHVQLLGSDPACMADNAARAVTLGAPAIDLNFGCPAKTVNRHRGGAVLLDEPELVGRVVSAVRAAVPPSIPVSVKMRLGNDDHGLARENGLAVEQAGAAWLTIHGRTKVQGYTPPAYWDRIALVRESISIPVIANGEVWTSEDARQCLSESGCADIMLGRGAVADPFLARALATGQGRDWRAVLGVLAAFADEIRDTGTERQVTGRLKQWFNYLRRRWPEAEPVYQDIRRLQSLEVMIQRLVLSGGRAA